MDIYTLGLVVYEMVTGRLPFSDRKSKVISAILSDQLVAPSVYRPNVDKRLEELIMAMLTLAPAQRPPISEVIKELKDLVAIHHDFRVPNWDPLSWIRS